MSARHLTKGSLLPQFTGKLRVYSMRFCPFAQRTILVLNAKKIPYEVVNINLTVKPEWLTTKSPLGKVPAIEIENNLTVYESLVTAEYLDDKYPEPPLVSQDPLRKAQDKLIVENFNTVIINFYKGVMKNDVPDDIQNIYSGLLVVQEELAKRESKFLAGDQPGMVDYMIWPWFERFGLLNKYSNTGNFELDNNKFALLNNWISAMKEDHAVKGHYLDPETHEKYYEGKHSGNLNYDFLL